MTPEELDAAFVLDAACCSSPNGQAGAGRHPAARSRRCPRTWLALLKLAVKNGFLTDALWGLARTALSDYWQLRKSIGLQRYSEGGHAGETDGRRLRGKACPKECRLQSCANDVRGHAAFLIDTIACLNVQTSRRSSSSAPAPS
jgi:hypothetical protein